MSSPETIFLTFGAASLVLAVFLGWRTYQLITVSPECEDFATTAGTVSRLDFGHHFYGDWWLDITLNQRRFRVAPGPWQGRIANSLRRDPHVEVTYCPSRETAPPRAWELHQHRATLLTVSGQRLRARQSAPAALASAFLSAGGAIFGWLGSRAPRRRAA